MDLLSTDFDGTLVAFDSDGACSPAFAAVLDLHSRAGGQWAINTGRDFPYALEGLKKFRPPVEPDFLLTNEREIFFRASDGFWKPLHDWNQLCRERHTALFDAAYPLFEKLRHLAATHPGIRIIFEEGREAGLVTDNEQVMEFVAGFIDEQRSEFPEFSYQRNTIYLRFCHADYHKGSTLGELTRHLGLTRDHVFAAGDHFNDLSMLDGRYAAYPSCPSNAIPEVQNTVAAAQGHCAARPASDGVADSWHHFTALCRQKP